MGAIDTLITAVDTKLKTASFITASTNVVFGEDIDLAANADTLFPRIETIITKIKCNGYADQRNLQWAVRIGSAAYFRTTTDTPFATAAEMAKAIQYGKEIADLYFSFLDDLQAGSPPCSGFEKLGDYPEIFIEKELIPKTMSAIVFTEIELLLSDTETL